jgi:hypothetical protein
MAQVKTSHCTLVLVVVAITAACASAPPSHPAPAPPRAASSGPAVAAASPVVATTTADCIARAARVPGSGTTAIESAKLVPGNSMPRLPVREPRRFVVSVLVDTAGRADPATLDVPTTLDSESIEAVRAVLPGWQFSPARIGACPIRQVVRLTLSR